MIVGSNNVYLPVFSNVWRYVLPLLHRGGTRFCTRDVVLD
jgi:hypothetical protein